MRKLIFILLASFHGYQCFAQVSNSHTPKGIYTIKADYYFEHNNFIKAIENYGKSVDQNPNDIHSMLRLADAHYGSGEDSLASLWYGKAFGISSDIEDKYLLKYVNTLIKGKKYYELRSWLNLYNNRVSLSNDSETSDIIGDSTLVFTKNLNSINTSNSELGPALDKDKLIFSSNRSVAINNSGNGDYNFYSSAPLPNDKYESILPLHEEINSEASEGSIAIAQKSGRLYFTRTSQSPDREETSVEVFSCDLPDSPTDTIEIRKLDLGKKNYDIGHLTVNSEGTIMFFTSKNPKSGQRGFDIYKTEYNGKKWSKPEDLGSTINTKGDEIYPYLRNDSTLYFASNGHKGLGGFDIFKVNLLSGRAQIEHLDFPINTTSNDFSLVLNSDGDEGYLSSNRPGGLGGDDLYKVYILSIKTKKLVSETIVEESANPAEFAIYVSNGEVINLPDQGNLAFNFKPGVNYTLKVDNDSYKDETVSAAPRNVSTSALPDSGIYTFHIQKMAVSGKGGSKSEGVKHLHVNPGDLITFQLIPNTPIGSELAKSSVSFGNEFVTIDSKDTLFFSYVAEEILTPGTDDKVISSNLDPEEADDLSADTQISDAPLLTEELITENSQVDNETSIADSLSLNAKALEVVAQANQPMNSNEVLDGVKADDSNGDLAPILEKTETISKSQVPTAKDQLTNTSEENFQYRVQIAASISEISETELKRKYRGSKEIRVFEEDRYYKYYIAETPTYLPARQILRECGVADAFIAVYKGNTKWKLHDAIASQRKESVGKN